MFTREFFLLVSWAGGTRCTEKKTAFKSFERTINFFISLVRNCHPSFSYTSCINFFKRKSIGNASARAKNPPKRVSHRKSRTKTPERFKDLKDDTDYYIDDDQTEHLVPAQYTRDENEVEYLDEHFESGDNNKDQFLDASGIQDRTEAILSVETCATNKRNSNQASSSDSSACKKERKRMRTQKMGFPCINPRLILDENDSELNDSDVSQMR